MSALILRQSPTLLPCARQQLRFAHRSALKSSASSKISSNVSSCDRPAKFSRRCRAQATPKEEADIEAMKREMQGQSIWDSEIFSIVFKVVVVAGIIGVTTLLATAAQPVINNVINAFPHAN